MPSDQERLECLQRAAASANPIGFVSILTSDFRWLLEQIDLPRGELDFCVACGAHVPPIAGEATCPVCDPRHSHSDSEKSPKERVDDAERN